MIELVVVVLILSLFVTAVQLNLFGIFRKNTFKTQVQDFVLTMQKAVTAAAESDRRYEVIIDLTEQRYTLRRITSPDLLQVLEEEIIIDNAFGNRCEVVYVLFDDMVETSENFQIAAFRAGHAGWQNGGKIVLLDEAGNPYSVIVNRINRIVKLERGDVELLMPKRENEVPF